MPLIPMPPMPTKWTRRFGPFTAVTPCSALIGHPVHPTCPATMRSNYRSSSLSSSRPALNDLHTDLRDVRRGPRTAEIARARRHRGPGGGVVEEGGERSGQPRPVEVPVEDHPGSPGGGENLRVAALVVVGGIRIGNQHRGQLHRADLGTAHGAGARDDDAGVAVGGAHVLDEHIHPGIEPEALIRGGDLAAIGGPGLMTDAQAAGDRTERFERGDCGLVQAVCALAAAEDQQPQTDGRGGVEGRENLGTDRVPGVDDPPRRKEGSGLREAEAHPAGEAPETSIRGARDRVLLEQHHRHPPQPGRHHPGDRGVAPDADDQAGSYTAHETERAAEPASERDRAARHPPRAPTADLASGKEVEGAARRGDQACLESLRGAGEGDAETTLDERRSERQRGKDVPSRAAAGDQDVQTPTAHPDSRASAISAPSSASETIIAEPPYDTNGRVSPLVGSAPSATPMLSSPCTTMRLVNPKARSEPNSSGWRAAMRRPRNATSAKSARTTPAPTRPSSSPITEKMKSVCAAGR